MGVLGMVCAPIIAKLYIGQEALLRITPDRSDISIADTFLSQEILPQLCKRYDIEVVIHMQLFVTGFKSGDGTDTSAIYSILSTESGHLISHMLSFGRFKIHSVAEFAINCIVVAEQDNSSISLDNTKWPEGSMKVLDNDELEKVFQHHVGIWV
jgi:hypothetical protein